MLVVIMLTNPIRSVKMVLAILLFVIAVVPFMPSAALSRVTEVATLRSQSGAAIYGKTARSFGARISICGGRSLFGIMGVSRPPPDNLAVGLGSLTGISGLLLMSAALGTAFWKGLRWFKKRSRTETGRSDLEMRARQTLYLVGAVATFVVIVNGSSSPTILEARVLEVYWALVATVFAPYRTSVEQQFVPSNSSEQANSTEECYA